MNTLPAHFTNNVPTIMLMNVSETWKQKTVVMIECIDQTRFLMSIDITYERRLLYNLTYIDKKF